MPSDLTRGGQFAIIHAKVLYDDTLPATAKLLYGECYRLSSAEGYCKPSNEALARIVGCSEKTVTRLISQLRDAGHIRVKMIRRHGATGDIVQRRIFCGLELAREDPPENTPEEAPGGIPKNEETSPQKCPDGIPKNEYHTIEKESNSNTPISPTGKTPKIPPDVLLRIDTYAGEDGELLDAIVGLLENRIVAVNQPVKTLRAVNGILTKLDRLSCGKRAWKLLLLDNAIVNNWRTVFPLKQEELPAETPLRATGGDGEIDGI